MQLPRRTAVLHDQGGMALVMTLMAVSFLVAITVQLTTSVNWQMQGAGNLRDSVQLDAISRSGLSLARAALLADLRINKFDSKHDSWGIKLTESAPSLFGQGKLQEVVVTDLSGLVQVNALSPDLKIPPADRKKWQTIQIDLWTRLLTAKNLVADEDEAHKLIDAIIDWIDEDDNENSIYGAESGYYQSLSPSYKARNAPITYLEELLLIRGMTPDLFNGIKGYLTEAGRDGKININTAPKELFMVLDPLGNMTQQTSDDLDEFRLDEKNQDSLKNLTWYKQVNPGLELETGQEGLLVVKSNFFKVSVTAEHNKMIRTGTGNLERIEGKEEQKLWYWEVR